MKNLLNLNGAQKLSKNEQQSINGGVAGCTPCPEDVAGRASCIADGGLWIEGCMEQRKCGFCKCFDGTHDNR
ncbi:hypothetical protein [Aquimarina sp. 2201CG5-10]|uniref:hypothetical protein n=1 Tax=Aquimarina callyspongiae TaxID=3098150 RepID=UPI002AB3597F|nr:hypothetical protein [Aquimarina sp. 2201CG5-10]MDY8138296.1 hypothetical protein [Aquimarina sp. 2201CG5-10]